jgi:peroxiredoxin Q/BCP
MALTLSAERKRCQKFSTEFESSQVTDNQKKQVQLAMFHHSAILYLSLAFVVCSALVVIPPLSSRRAFLQTTVATSAAAALLGVPTAAIAATSVDSVGSIPLTNAKAPEFELPNSRGEGVTSLSSLTANKKWTVLYFYPGAFTKGCTLEARSFQKDIEEYRKLNAQIVGVSVDPVEKNAQFCSAEGLDFYMLSDTGGRVSKLYGSALSVPGFGAFSNRQTYIIDPNGNLRWIFTDVESRIPRHSSEVLEKLRELEGKQSLA